jgi:hypothetical protein
MRAGVSVVWACAVVLMFCCLSTPIAARLRDHVYYVPGAVQPWALRMEDAHGHHVPPKGGVQLASADFIPWEETGTGWCVLSVNASYDINHPEIDDGMVTYAAGYAEAAVSTREVGCGGCSPLPRLRLIAGLSSFFPCVRVPVVQIFNFYLNTAGALTLNGSILPLLQPMVNYVETNINWTRSMAEQNKDDDPFWYEAWLINRQWEGIRDGFWSTTTPAQNVSELLLMAVNYGGDISGVISAFVPSINASTINPLFEHCSAFVRVASGIKRGSARLGSFSPSPPTAFL